MRRRRKSKFPTERSEIKEMAENGTPGAGGEEPDPHPACLGVQKQVKPGQAQTPDNNSEMSETKWVKFFTHPLFFWCHIKPPPQQAPGSADFASS